MFSNNKIKYFIIITFAISLAAVAFIKLFNLSYGSFGFTLITLFGLMWAPAVASFWVKKIIYKEPLSDYGLQFKEFDFKWLIFSAIGTIFFVLSILFIVYLMGNIFQVSQFGYVDFSTEGLYQAIYEMAGENKINIDTLPHPFILLLLGTAGGAVAGAFINLPFTFGEELGWRGLLYKELQSYGFIKSSILIGIIWGIWHAPLVLMGHNYKSASITGVLMMILFCITLSFPMAFVRVKTKNVLGPSLLHGMLNGSANILGLFVHNGNLLYNGPAGIAGIIVLFVVSTLIIFFDSKFLKEYPLHTDIYEEAE